MIKHEATRPLVFSSSYYRTRQNLLDIDNLDVDKLDIHAYRCNNETDVTYSSR